MMLPCNHIWRGCEWEIREELATTGRKDGECWEKIVSIPTFLGGGGGVCEPREDSQEPGEMWREVAEIRIIG